MLGDLLLPPTSILARSYRSQRRALGLILVRAQPRRNGAYDRKWALTTGLGGVGPVRHREILRHTLNSAQSKVSGTGGGPQDHAVHHTCR